MPSPPEASEPRRCVGVMSGTSLDGIDVAVVDITGSGRQAVIEPVHAITAEFSPSLRRILSDLVDAAGRTGSADLGLIARLQIRLAHEYAGAVRSALNGIEALDGAPAPDPYVVGCHGQTVFHAPEPEPVAGLEVGGTIQLGDPSALAVLLGMTVVGDFRVADIALGGEGAPIVPYLDWCVLGSGAESRLALNIGGIANVTVLPAGSGRGDVTAFDTGPGNCLIDAACHRLLGRPFDRDGEIASSGRWDDALLSSWMDDPYFRRPPPKSTGREVFDTGYADRLIGQALGAGLQPADTLATITELTAASVADAIERFTRPDPPARRMIVSGGGGRNRALMAGLARRLPGMEVESSAAHGVDPDSKEAILCAFLAHEAMAGVATGMPSVTGASRAAVLGKICQGGHRTPAPR